MAEQVIEQTPTAPNVMSSVTSDDGFTVESNFETPDQLRKGLGLDEPVAQPTAPAPQKSRNRRDDPRAAVQSAVGKQREAERVAAEATARAEKIEQELAELRKTPPQAAPVAAPAPAPLAAAPPVAAPQPVAAVTDADYERYAAMPDAPDINKFAGDHGFQKYQFAVSHFIAGKMFAENMQRMAQQGAEQQRHAQFTERLMAAKVRIPDFDQRFNPQTPIDMRIVPHVQRLENAPDVMLYLSDHQDIAQRLTTLHPIDQIGQIGEIAGMLKAQSAAAPSPASARPAISQAKPPTKRVSGAPPAATDEPPGDDASEADYEAYWGPRRRDSHSPRRRHR